MVHSSIFFAFEEFERQILLPVFRRQCNEAKSSKLGQLIWELVFAIRMDVVDRDVARELFVVGWKIFQGKRLEELLLPLGRALAWSYCLDGLEGSTGREEEAFALLTALVHGDAPFDHKSPPKFKYNSTMLRTDFERVWPKVTLEPVIHLLKDLTGSPYFTDKEIEIRAARMSSAMYMAEIQGAAIRVFRMDEEARFILRSLGPQGIRRVNEDRKFSLAGEQRGG